MILSPDQLEELTARKRPSWQARELEHLHIPYQTRTDGTLIVFEADVRPTQEQAPQRRRPQLKFA